MNIFMGNSLWNLVVQSDRISKLVLLVLLALSVACWTVFFFKMIMLRIKRKHMRLALERLKTKHTIDDMLSVANDMVFTVPGYFLTKNLAYLKTLLETQKDMGKQSVSEYDWELMQQHMYQSIDNLVHADEAYLPVLSTSAAVAPLLGLFGTVWGLVHAFIGISERQSADITTVAPGIAEALITTLAGLIVAIPALIMFNFLQIQVRALEQQYGSLADRIGFVVQRLLMR